MWECLILVPLSCYIIPLPSYNLPLLICGNHQLCFHCFLLHSFLVYIEPYLPKVNSASSAALSFCSQLVLSSHCPFQELLHSSFEIIFKVGLTNLGVLLVSISPLPILFLVSLDQFYEIIQTITLSR